MTKTLNPDQAGHSVGPDLGPNCLQRLADNKSRASTERDNNAKVQINKLFERKIVSIFLSIC